MYESKISIFVKLRRQYINWHKNQHEQIPSQMVHPDTRIYARIWWTWKSWRYGTGTRIIHPYKPYCTVTVRSPKADQDYSAIWSQITLENSQCNDLAWGGLPLLQEKMMFLGKQLNEMGVERYLFQDLGGLSIKFEEGRMWVSKQRWWPCTKCKNTTSSWRWKFLH